MKWLLHVFAPLLSISILAIMQKNAINNFFMGFFRDLGRIKAKNRRMGGNSMALSTKIDILLKRDDPLEGVDFDAEAMDEMTTYTSQELFEFGDGTDDKPTLLSVFGRVYDVSAGSKFYGPDGPYGMFAGKDVTRALCTGCKAPECLVRSTEGLTDKQVGEGKRWLSFFQLHDKYAYVGNLEGDEREAWLDELIDAALKDKTVTEMPLF